MKYIILVVMMLTSGLILSGCNSKEKASEIVDATPTPVQGQTERNLGNGVYDIYDDELIKESKDKTIFLYFYSDSCGECRALQDDIQTNVRDIPEDLIIMKVDIVARGDLKDEYNIEKENTLVQIDSEGKELKKLETKKSLKEIIAEI
jgi:thioredoxin-related protein